MIKQLTILISASLLLFCHSPVAAIEISRIEPPFWWAGMSSERLQLMVSGKQLGQVTVRSSDAAVKVSDVRPADNDDYLFITLTLSAEHKPGDTLLSFVDADGKTVEHQYTFLPRASDSKLRAGFSSKDVIYLATPDRFVNGDPQNDSVAALYEKVDRKNPDGRHGGDLAGLTESLAYLQALGITQVWLNPLLENNQQEYSYHGYSVSDLYNIDARFGGNEALLTFVEKAREHGIGLIMDTIPNHIGLNHWWMANLPSNDWVNHQGQFVQTSHQHEMIQDPYAPMSDRVAFNDGWFVPTMPDLNQRNPELATYLIQNNIWWVEYAGLSGLRVDTLPYADKHFTQRFNQRLREEYPNLNIVGEEWSSNPAIVSYWQLGKKNVDGFDAGTPSLMDFPLQEALIAAINNDQDPNAGMLRLHRAIANDFQYPNPNNLVVMGDNHDMNRLFTWVDEDWSRYKMALTYLMTTRGIPQLFYGTEILMSNRGTQAHGVIRSDFPGGWSGDKRNAFTGKGLSRDALRAQQFVKKLLNWRKQSSAVHTGRLIHYLPEDGVYTYFRKDQKSLVMVVMNNNSQAQAVATQRFAEVTPGISVVVDVFSGVRGDFGESITVPPKTALLFELY